MGRPSHRGGFSAGRPQLRDWLEGRGSTFLCVVVTGLAALSIYALTLAPGLTWAHDSADGGELAAAACTLGIAHPPGHPTYLLLAHSFTRLPFGQVATRTNLLSAVCAAGTAALLTWALARADRAPAAALSAGLALAFSPLLWSQATVTEVHALNALFTALLLALALIPNSEDTPSWWVALVAGCAWGLGLGNHPTILFCGPLVALILWRARRAGLWGLVGIVLGLSVYLYLPLRAATDPPINWGDPSTPAQFWRVVSGALYRHFAFSLPLRHLPRRLLAWSGLLARQFTGVGLAVATLGAMLLWEAERRLLRATAATLALCSIFAIGYNTVDSYLYLVPGLVCLGLWLGVGVSWLIQRLAARGKWLTTAAAVLAIGLPLVALPLRLPELDLSRDQAAQQFGERALGDLPPDTVVVSRRDSHTFALWYFQHCLNRRSDVTVVDPGLLGHDWYSASLSPLTASPLLTEKLQSGGTQDLREAAEIIDRPICQVASEDGRIWCTDLHTEESLNSQLPHCKRWGLSVDSAAVGECSLGE